MKAILVHQFGGPEVLKLEEVPTQGKFWSASTPPASIPMTRICVRGLTR